jgi:hypothetical protein
VKMEARRFSESLVPYYNTTRHHSPLRNTSNQASFSEMHIGLQENSGLVDRINESSDRACVFFKV